MSKPHLWKFTSTDCSSATESQTIFLHILLTKNNINVLLKKKMMPDALSCNPKYSQMPHALIVATILQPSDFRKVPTQVAIGVLGATQIHQDFITKD